MNTELFFNNAGDERGTPQDLFDRLDTKYHFEIDLAADERNHKCDVWFGSGGIAFDALEQDWAPLRGFLNPPYSKCGPFAQKAWEESRKGATVVGVFPVRTETKWWQSFVWARAIGAPRAGVFVDFLPGRLTFDLFVTDEQRAIIRDLEGNMDLTEIVEVTGLPKMAIRGIWEGKPNEDLLGNAPFPSCVIEWRQP